MLAVVIKSFFAQAFYVPSRSMEPGLIKNDRILVEKPSYWFGGSPQRGDVVVFADPGGWLPEADDAGPSNPLGKALVKIGLYPAGGHLVKRVIGVAGDTIHCCDKQGRLLVNGHPLDESSYLTPGLRCAGPEVDHCVHHWTSGPVPAGTVFVMGDNRDDSADSAYHLCHPARARSAVTEVSSSPSPTWWARWPCSSGRPAGSTCFIGPRTSRASPPPDLHPLVRLST